MAKTTLSCVLLIGLFLPTWGQATEFDPQPEESIIAKMLAKKGFFNVRPAGPDYPDFLLATFAGKTVVITTRSFPGIEENLDHHYESPTARTCREIIARELRRLRDDFDSDPDPEWR